MTALISKSSHFPDADDDFNHEAAEAVFSTVMKMDYDEARTFATMMHGAIIQRDLACYATPIAKALQGFYEERVREVSKALARGAVSKAASGGDATAELYAIDLISKAAESSSTYAEVARKRQRDLLTGQFVQEHKDIVHDGGGPIDAKSASMLGIAHPEEKLTRAQLANFQRGYHQVAQMMAQYGELPAKDAVLHLHYSDGTSSMAPPIEGADASGAKVLKPPVSKINKLPGNAGTVRTAGINPHKTLVGAQLSVLPNINTTGGTYQAAFGAAGLPGVGRVANTAVTADGALGRSDTWDPNEEGSFGRNWTQHVEGDEFTPSRKAFRRLAAGSAALESTLGTAAPPHLKIALQIGQHVGDLGPEAQKVIGPAADKAAYRYRGISRTPDERVVNAVGAVANRPGLSRKQKNDVLLHGTEDDLGNWRPSAPLSYLKSRLPKTELNTLQRMSGVIPPSEGIIIDKTGKVTSQSVGYGDDHYLPFNLKKLTGLRGGQYLRTRTWGGPTTEDIYTGLVGGAKSLGVVSHNGVYTIEFDDNLKGGRRFNDKAARMVARYGQLLDAVKSEQVTTGGIHPARYQELANQAAERYDQDEEPERYKALLDKLITSEKRDPKLSAQQTAEAGNEFFSQLAEKRHTADGHVMTAQELVGDWASVKAAQQYATDSKLVADMAENGMHPRPPRSVAENRADILSSLEDRDPVVAQRKVAEAMGATRQYDNAMKRATDDYKATLKPLALDAQGYQLALAALQEQFPYYIKRVDYHPWVDAKAGKDTGYVMPKHNRPAAVLAGYFDPAITGKGKAFANTIRNQNRGVHQGKIRYVPTSAEKKAEQAERIRGKSAGSAGNVTSGAPNQAESAELKRYSTDALVQHLRSQTKFSMGAGKTTEQRQAIGNQMVTPDLIDLLKPQAELHTILSGTDSQIEALKERNPSGWQAAVDRALKQAEDYNLFDLDTRVVRDYKNGGLSEGPRSLGEHPAKDLVDHPNQEYDFDHIAPEFAEDRNPSIENVLDRYGRDQRIQHAVDQGLVPADPTGGDAFKAAISTAQAKLGGQVKDRLTWDLREADGRAHGNPPARMADLDEQAEGVLRAKQLQRRYVEAVKREQNSQIITPTSPPNVTIIDATGSNPADIMRGLAGANGQ